MPSAIRFAIVLALTSACQSPAQPTKADASATASSEAEPTPEPSYTPQTLAAAGLTIRVPSEWQVLPEDDPDFALAYDATQKQPSACWIERRRQGLGPLPVGTRAISEGEQRRGYMRGVVRGIVHERPGPEGSTLVVHCRARRSDTKLWRTVILPAMGSVEVLEPAAEPTPASLGSNPIVELCSAAPIVPSYACALRADGAVYCGQTDAALERVEVAAAIEIGCRGTVACARAATGEVACWVAGEAPQAQPSFGKARSLTDACVVDERGAVHCLRSRPREGGGHELVSAPLQAFDDPSLALAGVEVLMPSSTASQGCAATSSDVICWDELGELPVRFGKPAITSDEASGRRRQAPEPIDARGGVVELRRLGDRLCSRTSDPLWRCTTATGEAHELLGCASQACGCSLMGGHHFNCEDSPEPRIDTLPQGRLAGVVAVAEPCVARRDGSVACRELGSTRLRTLELREPAPKGTPTATPGL